MFGGSCIGGIVRGFLVVTCSVCACSGRVGCGFYFVLFSVVPF